MGKRERGARWRENRAGAGEKRAGNEGKVPLALEYGRAFGGDSERTSLCQAGCVAGRYDQCCATSCGVIVVQPQPGDHLT